MGNSIILNSKYKIFLALGAICISFAPVFVKLIDPTTLGPTAIAFWRLLFGAIILFTWAKLLGQSLKIEKSIIKLTALAGAIFFIDLFLWHRSIFIVGAGMATILGNTQVFGTAILSFFIFKEKLTVRFFIAAVSAMVGVVLLVGVGSDISFSSQYITGILFGLGTAIAYSNYIVTIKVTGHKKECPKVLPMMAWVTFFSAIFTGVSTVIESSPMIPPDTYTYLVLFGLALVAQAVGWWLIAMSLPKVEGYRSGLILLIQPVLATIWGVMFFAEHLSAIQISGAAITLVAIYVGSIKKN